MFDEIGMDIMIGKRAWMDYIDRSWASGPQGNKQPFSTLYKFRQFQGERCFVVGGGPSLIGFDFSRLKDEFTIGINLVCEAFHSDIIYLADPSRILKRVQRSRGESNIVILDIENGHYDNCYYVKPAGDYGIPFDIDSIYSGSFSSYGAVNLAVALGFEPIYLLGYDFKFKDGKSHFLPKWGAPEYYEERYLPRSRSEMDGLLPILRGREIYNLNPDSALRSFPFLSVEEVLK